MTPDWDSPGTSALRGVLALVRRRRITLFAVTLIVVAAAFAWTGTRETNYRAVANVLLASQDLAQALTGTDRQPLSDSAQARVPLTQASLASNPAVIQTTIEKARRAREPAREFLKHASVELLPNSDILVFSVDEASPLVAQRVVNAWAQTFSQYRFRLDTAPIQQALKGLDQQLASTELSAPLRDDLLGKRQQLEALKALQTSNARVVRPATEALSTRSSPVRVGALAVIAGLCLGLLAALLRDRTDLRVRDAATIERRTNLPFLGRLPQLARSQRGRPALTVRQHPMDEFAQSLRALRARLELALDENGATSVAISSAVPSEGKTTLAANLAYSTARTGRRVIVVDLDLRRPALHRVYDIPHNRGVVGCLLDGVPLEDALVPIDIDPGSGTNLAARGSLQVLPAGVLATDPSELFRSPGFARLMRELHARADVLILDTAPLLPVGDTVTLSPHVQAMAIVVALPGLTVRVVDELEKAVRSLRCVTVGFATNMDSSWSAFGYEYGAAEQPELRGSVG